MEYDHATNTQPFVIFLDYNQPMLHESVKTLLSLFSQWILKFCSMHPFPPWWPDNEAAMKLQLACPLPLFTYKHSRVGVPVACWIKPCCVKSEVALAPPRFDAQTPKIRVPAGEALRSLAVFSALFSWVWFSSFDFWLALDILLLRSFAYNQVLKKRDLLNRPRTDRKHAKQSRRDLRPLLLGVRSATYQYSYSVGYLLPWIFMAFWIEEYVVEDRTHPQTLLGMETDSGVQKSDTTIQTN
jgi:hypothetical protein